LPQKTKKSGKVQSVPEKMRLEMVIRIQNEIPDGQSSGLFSNEPFEKKPVKIIEDFVWHSDDYFGSHFLGNWLYTLLTLEKKNRQVSRLGPTNHV